MNTWLNSCPYRNIYIDQLPYHSIKLHPSIWEVVVYMISPSNFPFEINYFWPCFHGHRQLEQAKPLTRFTWEYFDELPLVGVRFEAPMWRSRCSLHRGQPGNWVDHLGGLGWESAHAANIHSRMMAAKWYARGKPSVHIIIFILVNMNAIHVSGYFKVIGNI